jgi:hypothetical protein
MCSEHVRLHNKVVRHIQSETLIRVVKKVASKDAVLLVFTGASFASNADFTSQLGHVIVLWSRRTHAAVVLEAKSTKSRRVTRSVLGAELCGVSHGYDRGYMVRHQMAELLGCTIPLVLLTDSLQIFHAITRLSAFSEKRLHIDAAVLRAAYEAGELHTIAHVAGGDNLADCLTKIMDSAALVNVLRTGTLHLRLNKAIRDEAKAAGLM